MTTLKATATHEEQLAHLRTFLGTLEEGSDLQLMMNGIDEMVERWLATDGNGGESIKDLMNMLRIEVTAMTHELRMLKGGYKIYEDRQ